MKVEFEWAEHNSYKDTVTLDPEVVRAAGYEPDDPSDVAIFLQENPGAWVEQIQDFNAAHMAVLHREVTGVVEIDPLAGALTA
jgi:hypothetical protein